MIAICSWFCSPEGIKGLMNKYETMSKRPLKNSNKYIRNSLRHIFTINTILTITFYLTAPLLPNTCFAKPNPTLL